MDHAWVSTYANLYSRAELEEEITALKDQAKKGAGLFSSQSEGGASYTKDLIALRNRMEAAAHVMRYKYGTGADPSTRGSGTADFSGVVIS